MPFFVYGRDAKTGEVLHRFFSEASTQEEARRHGEAHGIEVSAVVACTEADRPADSPVAVVPSRAALAHAADVETKLSIPGEMATFRHTLEDITPRVFVTHTLVALNALVFVMMAISGADLVNPSLKSLLDWGAEFGPMTTNGQWWRLFTSLFVHIGFMHLAYNMLAFVYAGPIVERMVGNVGFLVLYLVSGLGGSLWSLYYNPLILHAGASGAIFGIYGALLGIVLRQEGTIPPHVSAALRKLVLMFVAYNFIYSLQPNVGFAAHFGGLVTGFIGGLILGQPLKVDALDARPMRDAGLALIGFLLLVVGLLACESIYPNLETLQAQLSRFDALDTTLSKTYRDAWINNKYEHLSDDDFADMIENDLLPKWRDASEGLDSVKPIGKRLERSVATISDYMRLRQDGWTVLLEGLHTGDKDKKDEGAGKEERADSVDRDIVRMPRTRVLVAH